MPHDIPNDPKSPITSADENSHRHHARSSGQHRTCFHKTLRNHQSNPESCSPHVRILVATRSIRSASCSNSNCKFFNFVVAENTQAAATKNSHCCTSQLRKNGRLSNTETNEEVASTRAAPTSASACDLGLVRDVGVNSHSLRLLLAGVSDFGSSCRHHYFKSLCGKRTTVSTSLPLLITLTVAGGSPSRKASA